MVLHYAGMFCGDLEVEDMELTRQDSWYMDDCTIIFAALAILAKDDGARSIPIKERSWLMDCFHMGVLFCM